MWDLKKYSDNKAIIDEFENTLTYDDLEKECCKLSDAIGNRCLVFILCTNSIGSLIGYVSCLNSRTVPLLISANLDKELLSNLIETYKPDYLWMPDSMSGEYGAFQRSYASFSYTLLDTGYNDSTPIFEDLALLLTTSGSTGSPKFVRQSYANIRANTDSIIKYLELSESERPITTLPMNYTYGLSIINTHLAVGATILVTEKGLMQKEFWSFFKEHGATSFGGVPYTYEMLDRLRFTRMELPALRTMTQAGGKLSVELHKKYAEYAKEKGKNFVVMYGQCEATARMGYLPAEMSLEKCGSMGVAIPGGKFGLFDSNGIEIDKPHIMGELVYEGTNVTLGYAECREDLNKGDERGGVLETGDMAEFDEDGYYYIVGRKKRFLKLYGNRVNLDEIERLIKAHFSTTDVACAGIDDHMFIFITDDSDTQDIKDFTAKKTGINHSAFNIMHIEKIPQNDAGKILYKKLETYYK